MKGPRGLGGAFRHKSRTPVSETRCYLELPKTYVSTLVQRALEEDLGPGDITTRILLPPGTRARAEIYTKEDGILAGIKICEMVFRALDESVKFEERLSDGQEFLRQTILAEIEGPARVILAGERTALNFLQHLSGIATLTARAVRLTSGSPTKILDTRKTIPCLRLAEKYAVEVGGGKNHRLGLYDGILIKNNHLAFLPLGEAVRRAREKAPLAVKVEVEVEDLPQLEEALEAGADIIMLDNMDLELVAHAMKIVAGRAKIEVSGKVTPDRVASLCELGVDYISMGTLTHSAKAIDISMRVIPESP